MDLGPQLLGPPASVCHVLGLQICALSALLALKTTLMTGETTRKCV